jgi:hypothetical protein
MATKDDPRALTVETLGLIARLEEIGRDIDGKLSEALDLAWRVGLNLLAKKESVGHGKWLIWVEANLPIGERHARRYMELASQNTAAKTVDDLSEDSVRKFRLGYVPEKERGELPGDQTIPRVHHHLAIVNDFRKLQRRVEIGQAQLNQAEAKRDLWPVFEWMVGLYGLNPETIADLRPPQ